MSPIDASKVEQTLLRNQNLSGKCVGEATFSRLMKISVPLGLFDGRVAVIHPSSPEWYISSPNAEYIPLPPGQRCNVYPCFDGRFGPDNHTQWPQPFSEKYLHLSCIPKKMADHEHSVIWQDPLQYDFIHIQHNGEKIGLGRWSEQWLQPLRISCSWLQGQVSLCWIRNKALDSHPQVMPLCVYLERALSRLRSVPMSERGATISLRLVQRLWLELYGLLEYVDKYLPSMDGQVPPLEQQANVIGCFVRTAYSAERLFAAGIPYWFVREIRTFNTENICPLALWLSPIIP
jgi:hypothetical protein